MDCKLLSVRVTARTKTFLISDKTPVKAYKGDANAMPATARKLALQSTTVRLPQYLYEEARCAVQKGVTEASSLNDLFIESLREKLKQLRRSQIDAAFAEMKNDQHYRREAEKITADFAANDSITIKCSVTED